MLNDFVDFALGGHGAWVPRLKSVGVVLGNPCREIKRSKQHLVHDLCAVRAIVLVSLVFVEPFKGKSQMHHMS